MVLAFCSTTYPLSYSPKWASPIESYQWLQCSAWFIVILIAMYEQPCHRPDISFLLRAWSSVASSTVKRTTMWVTWSCYSNAPGSDSDMRYVVGNKLVHKKVETGISQADIPLRNETCFMVDQNAFSHVRNLKCDFTWGFETWYCRIDATTEVRCLAP